MKKVYIAKRIPKNPLPHLVLSISNLMSVEQIHSLYVNKVFADENYIYNGPWILRPPLTEEDFSRNNLPVELKPQHVWKMVKEKIEASDVVIGIISGKAYGTIAEVGYACNCKNIAVYVLPEQNIQEDELQDLWFLFQMAKETKDLWSENDIKNVKEFSKIGINSLQDYVRFLENIVPNFIRK